MTNTSRIRVGVVLIKKDEILLVSMHRDSGDIFVLPGGGLEIGETMNIPRIAPSYDFTRLADEAKIY